MRCSCGTNSCACHSVVLQYYGAVSRYAQDILACHFEKSRFDSRYSELHGQQCSCVGVKQNNMRCSWHKFVHTPLGCAAESRCGGLLSAGYIIACHFEKSRFDSRHNLTCIRVLLHGQQVFICGCGTECMSFRWFKFVHSDRSDVTCAVARIIDLACCFQ
jgi:hypothetical protein